MQVKTYIGNSTKEVLEAIKAELGPDAVILSSREQEKDGRRVYEITAGAERPDQNKKRIVNNAAQAATGANIPSGWDDWHKEWDRLKDHIYSLMQPAMHWDKLSPHQRIALEYLQREGVESNVIVECYKTLISPKAVDLSMLKVLASLVPVRPFSFVNYPQRIHIMAGPYGSGKTSTALRMAFLRKQERPQHNIAFINADSMRGNGRLVLRHWADLSGFPYFEAPDRDAMYAALNACKEVNCIFIDMQGVAKNEKLDDKLRVLGLDTVQANVYLTLSPHYSYLKDLLRRYQNPYPTSIVWTKLDEAEHYAELINVAVWTGLPISALSYGAELQGTLSPSEEAQIWRLILKHQLPKG